MCGRSVASHFSLDVHSSCSKLPISRHQESSHPLATARSSVTLELFTSRLMRRPTDASCLSCVDSSMPNACPLSRAVSRRSPAISAMSRARGRRGANWAFLLTVKREFIHSQHTNTQTVTPSTRHSHLAHISPASFKCSQTCVYVCALCQGRRARCVCALCVRLVRRCMFRSCCDRGNTTAY